MVRVLETTHIGRVTGRGSHNRTDERFSIHGTDLGAMWDDGHGQVFVIFGDTYGAGWGGDGPGPPGADWRRNVLAVSTGGDLDAGLSLHGVLARDDGSAAQVIASGRGREATVIPNAGIAVGATQYVHYMSVRRWTHPPGTWRTNYAGIAVSEDHGRTWRKPRSARWRNDRHGNRLFQLGAFAPAGEHVHLLGTTNGRYGAIYLARAQPSGLLDVGSYEYWTGRAWDRSERAATPIADGDAGELSVAYHRHLGKWLLMHLDQPREGIVLRSAERLTGPWSDGEVVVSGREHPAIYGGYLHPWAMDGPEIYYTISQWRPYNVYFMRSSVSP